MSKTAIFKSTTFGGFDRQSVLTYIDELGVKNAKKEEELNIKINELSQINAELEKTIKEQEETMLIAQDKIKHEKEKVHHLSTELERLNTEIYAYKKEINEQNREIQIRDEQNKMITNKLESYEDKLDMFNNTATEAGSVILEAKHSANLIVKRAMSEVETIRSKTAENFETISGEIDFFKRDIDTLRSTISQVMTTITIKLDELTDCVDELESRCKKMSAPFDVKEISYVVEETDESESY